jgi:hypothetical protein
VGGSDYWNDFSKDELKCELPKVTVTLTDLKKSSKLLSFLGKSHAGIRICITLYVYEIHGFYSKSRTARE